MCKHARSDTKIHVVVSVSLFDTVTVKASLYRKTYGLFTKNIPLYFLSLKRNYFILAHILCVWGPILIACFIYATYSQFPLSLNPTPPPGG